MERANEKNFFAACDALKQQTALRVSNLFLDNRQICKKIENSECYFLRGAESLFFLVPSHEVMHSLYFLSASPEALAADLPALLNGADPDRPIRTSVIGREEMCKSVVAALEQNGFTARNTLLRMLIPWPTGKILEGMRLLAADYLGMATFAREEDAEAVRDLIHEEFDIIKNNIPDLDEIRENIKNNNVTIIRMNGVIAAMHYFYLENGILHGYFDITRKSFRGGNGLMFALNIFELEYFKREGIKINRYYGWRDASKTRLIKSSSKTKAVHDGIVIHNLLWGTQAHNELV